MQVHVVIYVIISMKKVAALTFLNTTRCCQPTTIQPVRQQLVCVCVCMSKCGPNMQEDSNGSALRGNSNDNDDDHI